MPVLLFILWILVAGLISFLWRKFLDNREEIEILYKQLVFFNQELKQKPRVDHEFYKNQTFTFEKIPVKALKLPVQMIDKSKFECKTYEGICKDYTAYFRPLLLAIWIWFLLGLTLVYLGLSA